MAWRSWMNQLIEGFLACDKPGKVNLKLKFADGSKIAFFLDDPYGLVSLGALVHFAGRYRGGPVTAVEDSTALIGGEIYGFSIDETSLYLTWDNIWAGTITLEAPVVLVTKGTLARYRSSARYRSASRNPAGDFESPTPVSIRIQELIGLPALFELGAKRFFHTERALEFHVADNPRKITHVSIWLRPGTSTYTVTFYRLMRKHFKQAVEEVDVRGKDLLYVLVAGLGLSG